MGMLKCMYCTLGLAPSHHLLYIVSSDVLTYFDIYQLVRIIASMRQQRRDQTAAAVQKSQVDELMLESHWWLTCLVHIQYICSWA